MGVPPEQINEQLPRWAEPEDAADVLRSAEAILTGAMALRDAETGPVRPGPLGRALDYIRRHTADPDLTLADTAEAAGVTASYLSALFRKELGRTFSDYVTGRRMELARRLLLTTDKRPGQIARAVGYRDGHYFSAVFKKTQGRTPTDFRAGRA